MTSCDLGQAYEENPDVYGIRRSGRERKEPERLTAKEEASRAARARRRYGSVPPRAGREGLAAGESLPNLCNFARWASQLTDRPYDEQIREEKAFRPGHDKTENRMLPYGPVSYFCRGWQQPFLVSSRPVPVLCLSVV